MQQVFVPEQLTETVMVPEVTQQYKPVTVTSYRDELQTKQVPVEVQSTQRYYETRKVPVTVQKPVLRYVTREVPEQVTRYETQEIIEQTPVRETTYEEVEVVEEYPVRVKKVVPVTRTIEVPKQTSREVTYETTERVARIVEKKIPVDQYGNELKFTDADEVPEYVKEPTTANRPTLDSDESAKADGESGAYEGTLKRSTQPATDIQKLNGETKASAPMQPLNRPQPKEADLPPELNAPIKPEK
ncbi:MAG: hypothetical protein R3C03_13470 [Pirellulaceae bacterium]